MQANVRDISKSNTDQTRGLNAHLETWASSNDWRERIITFNASWFTVSMGTGVVVQNLTNIPYPAQWLRNLGYCFWVLDIVLFLFFTLLGLTRMILYPKLAKATLEDISQTSYLGAIPITVDTIIVGITLFYSQRTAAIWVAYGLFWVATAMSVWLGCAIVFIACDQKPHDLEDVTGVWLLGFIPLIVTSATGSAIVTHINEPNEGTILVVSFLMWSVGVSLSCIILCIYFWRLLSCNLPPRDAIVSCFIPMGPTGEGAYAIQGLAVGLSRYIEKRSFVLLRDRPENFSPAALSAVAETLNWIGLLIGLFLTAFSTFWLVEATSSVLTKVPKHFNVGFWAFVFPMGVYTNSLCSLAEDLGNPGFRGWAATCVVLTVLLWLGCALGTLYRGVWLGKLFFAPGLEGWNEKRTLKPGCDGTEEETSVSGGDMFEGPAMGARERRSRPDGTYHVAR